MYLVVLPLTQADVPFGPGALPMCAHTPHTVGSAEAYGVQGKITVARPCGQVNACIQHNADLNKCDPNLTFICRPDVRDTE